MLKWLTQINSLLIWQLRLRCMCVCAHASVCVCFTVCRLGFRGWGGVGGAMGGGAVQWDDSVISRGNIYTHPDITLLDTCMAAGITVVLVSGWRGGVKLSVGMLGLLGQIPLLPTTLLPTPTPEDIPTLPLPLEPAVPFHTSHCYTGRTDRII